MGNWWRGSKEPTLSRKGTPVDVVKIVDRRNFLKLTRRPGTVARVSSPRQRPACRSPRSIRDVPDDRSMPPLRDRLMHPGSALIALKAPAFCHGSEEARL